MGSGLGGLQMKGAHPGESFTISRNWVHLGEAVSPGTPAVKTSETPG